MKYFTAIDFRKLIKYSLCQTETISFASRLIRNALYRHGPGSILLRNMQIWIQTIAGNLNVFKNQIAIGFSSDFRLVSQNISDNPNIE